MLAGLEARDRSRLDLGRGQAPGRAAETIEGHAPGAADLLVAGHGDRRCRGQRAARLEPVEVGADERAHQEGQPPLWRHRPRQLEQADAEEGARETGAPRLVHSLEQMREIGLRERARGHGGGEDRLATRGLDHLARERGQAPGDAPGLVDADQLPVGADAEKRASGSEPALLQEAKAEGLLATHHVGAADSGRGARDRGRPHAGHEDEGQVGHLRQERLPRARGQLADTRRREDVRDLDQPLRRGDHPRRRDVTRREDVMRVARGAQTRDQVSQRGTQRAVVPVARGITRPPRRLAAGEDAVTGDEPGPGVRGAGIDAEESRGAGRDAQDALSHARRSARPVRAAPPHASGPA